MSETREEQAWLRTVSLIVLAAAAVTIGLYYTQPVMVPFVLALFLVVMVAPVLDGLIVRARAPRPVAVLATLLLVVAAIAMFCLIMIVAAQRIVSTAGQYTESFAALAGRALEAAEHWGVRVDKQALLDELRANMPGMLGASLGTAMSIVSNVFLVLIFTAFLLMGRAPRAVRTGAYAEIDRHVRRYIAIKVALSALTGILVAGTLYLLGLELAGIFGLLAFFLNFIPSVGSIVATLLPVPLAIAQYENPWMVLPVVAVPGAIQIAIGNGIEPKMMGEGLNLHPVTVLLALAFWGLLWGVVGMVLAAPLTAVVRIVLLHFETVRPIAELMAGKLPEFASREASAPTLVRGQAGAKDEKD